MYIDVVYFHLFFPPSFFSTLKLCCTVTNRVRNKAAANGCRWHLEEEGARAGLALNLQLLALQRRALVLPLPHRVVVVSVAADGRHQPLGGLCRLQRRLAQHPAAGRDNNQPRYGPAPSRPRHGPITAPSQLGYVPVTSITAPLQLSYNPVTAMLRPGYSPITVPSWPHHGPVTTRSWPRYGPVTSQLQPRHGPIRAQLWLGTDP